MPDPKNRLTWNATCKVYPAICDLQAPDDTIREHEVFVVTVGGNNERLLYECPAGKCAVVQYSYAYTAAANPGGLYFILKVGVQIFYLLAEAHVGGQRHIIKPDIFLKAGDYFGTIWTTCVIGNALTGAVVGYEIPQY